MQNKKAPLVKIYTYIIIVAGFVILAYLTVTSPPSGNWWPFVFLCLLAIVTETQTITIGGDGVSVTISVIICSMMTCSLTETAWVAVVSLLGMYSKTKDKGAITIFTLPVLLTLFNMASFVLELFAADKVYRVMGGNTLTIGTPFDQVMHQITSFAPALIVAILVYVFINTLIVAFFRSIQMRQSLLSTWSANMLWSITSLIFLGLLGIIITAVFVTYNWFVVLVLFAPFMLARYVFSMYKDLQENYLQTVTCLATAIEAKDSYTIGHSRRVEFYSGIIAAELRLNAKRSGTLRYAALLHDIGKIGIDEAILRKPARLTPEEMEILREHPGKGAHIIEGIEFLSEPAKILRSHHEYYNGKGYPDGLSGNDISLEAQILCVADSYDAMTSQRPYRPPLTHEQAIEELYRCSGSQFAPDVVTAFDKAMKKRGNKPYVV